MVYYSRLWQYFVGITTGLGLLVLSACSPLTPAATPTPTRTAQATLDTTLTLQAAPGSIDNVVDSTATVTLATATPYPTEEPSPLPPANTPTAYVEPFQLAVGPDYIVYTTEAPLSDADYTLLGSIIGLNGTYIPFEEKLSKWLSESKEFDADATYYLVPKGRGGNDPSSEALAKITDQSKPLFVFGPNATNELNDWYLK